MADPPESIAGREGARPLLVTLAYLGLALLTTWPLLRGLDRDIPSDLGDPALNVFILGRNLQRFEAALGGDLAALRSFWDARIFHPAPLTLAYSEHLLTQSLLVLPIHLAGGNPILVYNAAFLASFVLSALGAFLLARDLLGRADAAFLAGLAFGFAAYRVDQLSHVQVLSSQWMPFALLGFLRYARTGRAAPLAGGAAALVAQSLSCGYYALYFPPAAAVFALTWLARGPARRRPRAWLGLLLAAAAVAALVLPALLPYAAVRRSGVILRERWEVERFSADVYSYLTAPELLTVWGSRLRPYDLSEGGLFPGLTPLLLAGLAVSGGAWGALRRTSSVPLGGSPGMRRAVLLASALAAATLLVLVAVVLGFGRQLSELLPGLGLRRPSWLLFVLAALAAGLVAGSPRVRALGRAALGSDRALLLGGLVVAAWLSLGPTPRSFGRELPGLGLYAVLYEHVTGFDGLRVPARFAMLVALFLALLCGYGAVALARRFGRRSLLVVGPILLLETTPAPLLLNDVWAEPGLRRPPERLQLGADLPAIYGHVARLPPEAVIAELPFGSDPWELRYMLASLSHGRRLVNGFSGAQPLAYRRGREALRDPFRKPDAAMAALLAAETTHVIVHQGNWMRAERGARATRLLEQRGARRVAVEGEDVLLALPSNLAPR
jgi:hypothetical protein